MKKRVIAGFMAAMMAATLFAGCGSSEEQASSDNADTQKEETADAAEETAEETESTGESIVSKPTDLTLIFADGDEGFKSAMNDFVMGRRFSVPGRYGNRIKCIRMKKRNALRKMKLIPS